MPDEGKPPTGRPALPTDIPLNCPPATTGWHTVRAPIEFGRATISGDAAAGPGVVRYGIRALEIVEVQFLDAAGAEAHIFNVGAPLRVALRYRLNDLLFNERPTVIVAFHKVGVARSHRFWTVEICLSHAVATEGQLEVEASPLLLGAGTYAVTISVFREGYFDSAARHRFFSTNAEVLDIHSRGYEIVVRPSPNVLLNDVVFQHPAAWRLNGRLAADTRVIIDA